MKLKQKIGIVGSGFVGSAVRYGFSPNVGVDAEVRVYDVNPNKATHTLEETVNESDFIFLSVPTPANKNGSINIDILDKALNDINEVSERDNIVLIRSTVIPGTTRELQSKYHQLNLLFNPEFLTERSAKFDFINQSRFVVGSSGQAINMMCAERFTDLIRDRFGFGGSCFPKDIQAMIDYAENIGVEPTLLYGAWEKNLQVRPEEDWKQLKGRAVTDE